MEFKSKKSDNWLSIIRKPNTGSPDFVVKTLDGGRNILFKQDLTREQFKNMVDKNQFNEFNTDIALEFMRGEDLRISIWIDDVENKMYVEYVPESILNRSDILFYAEGAFVMFGSDELKIENGKLLIPTTLGSYDIDPLFIPTMRDIIDITREMDFTPLPDMPPESMFDFIQSKDQ